MTSPATRFSAHQDRNLEWQIPAIAERVWNCDPQDVVLQRYLSNAMSTFQFSSLGQVHYSWLHEMDIPDRSILTADFVPGTSTGVDCYGHPTYAPQSMSVEHPEYFATGNVLRVCSADLALPPVGQGKSNQGVGQREMFVWVQSRDITAGTITVYPGWGGTPVYTSIIDEEVCLLYSVAEECVPHITAYINGLESTTNYYQTFYDGYEYTWKSRMIQHYGHGSVAKEIERHRRQIMGGGFNGVRYTGKLPKQLERAIFYGVGNEGGATGVSSMGGINWFGIPQYTVSQLTYETFRGIIKDIYMSGGMVSPESYLCLVSPDVKLLIDDWVECRNCNEAMDNTKFGVKVDSITTSFGDINFTVHRQLRRNEIYILDTSKMGLLPVSMEQGAVVDGDVNAAWEENDLPNPDSAYCTKVQLAGTYGFALACPCHHAKIVISNECLDDCCGPDSVCYDDLPASIPDFCEVGVPV